MSLKNLCLFAITFIAAMTLLSRAESTMPDTPLTKEIVASETQDEPQVLAFEVTPSGFEPRETTIQPGKCLILLRNRSGRIDLNFWLARENGNKVSESDQKRRDWKAHVHL